MKSSLVLSIAICVLFRFDVSAAETASAAITVTSPDAIKVVNLETGQPRLYDSEPLRIIEKVSANLAGWEFTSIPQRIIMSYRIRVNKDGVIYAFGGGSSRKPPTREQFLGDEASRWVEETGVIAGPNIPMCFRRKVAAGETIALESFELSLAAESIAIAGADSSPLAGSGPDATNGHQSPLEVLSKEGPNAIEWALAPLDKKVPSDIRENITLLREDILDEEAKKPTASGQAYKLAEQLCNNVIETLNERDKARVRAGYTAVQAQANIEVTNQALEARRRFTSWPTYRREKDQRDELRKQKENGAALVNQRPVLEWADRGEQIRKILDTAYAQYREAARRPAVK